MCRLATLLQQQAGQIMKGRSILKRNFFREMYVNYFLRQQPPNPPPEVQEESRSVPNVPSGNPSNTISWETLPMPVRHQPRPTSGKPEESGEMLHLGIQKSTTTIGVQVEAPQSTLSTTGKIRSTAHTSGNPDIRAGKWILKQTGNPEPGERKKRSSNTLPTIPAKISRSIATQVEESSEEEGDTASDGDLPRTENITPEKDLSQDMKDREEQVQLKDGEDDEEKNASNVIPTTNIGERKKIKRISRIYEESAAFWKKLDDGDSPTLFTPVKKSKKSQKAKIDSPYCDISSEEESEKEPQPSTSKEQEGFGKEGVMEYSWKGRPRLVKNLGQDENDEPIKKPTKKKATTKVHHR